MKKSRAGQYVDFKYAKGATDICGKMFHDYYEIYLLINGEVEFINSNTRRKLKPFQVVIIPPGEYHHFVVTDQIEHYERCVLNIHQDFLDKELLEKAFEKKEILSFSESNRIINNFIYLTNSISTIDESDYTFILTAIAIDIIMLIKNAAAEDINSGTLDTIASEMIKYIDMHYEEPLTLESLSQTFNYSISSLHYSFKKNFGITIKKYIIKKRMIAAKLDLQKGESAEKTSKKYGFSNYSSFYRSYKKYFGVAPSETDPTSSCDPKSEII